MIDKDVFFFAFVLGDSDFTQRMAFIVQKYLIVLIGHNFLLSHSGSLFWSTVQTFNISILYQSPFCLFSQQWKDFFASTLVAC